MNWVSSLAILVTKRVECLHSRLEFGMFFRLGLLEVLCGTKFLREWFVKNGTANFGRNIPTEICGPPPEVIPNIPVRRNRNGSFRLNGPFAAGVT